MIQLFEQVNPDKIINQLQEIIKKLEEVKNGGNELSDSSEHRQ